ncbi:hypothetical protein D8Y23_05855 [Microbacterium enclense]|uniref:Uncharacterized protein n=1 Tax=Microbacterium enclense TaxID=993073 RepID=A0A443JIH3_9MICO|nr:hypothetical protein [Microbacterium enclense]RWR20348.1 hypothetical protein D8Y23_05855 [Microbacterium enclense]
MSAITSTRWLRFMMWCGVGILLLAVVSIVLILVRWAESGDPPSVLSAVSVMLSLATGILLLCASRRMLRRLSRAQPPVGE